MFGATRLDRELADEIESLLQMHVDANLRAGMSDDEARRQALVAIGGERLGAPSGAGIALALAAAALAVALSAAACLVPLALGARALDRDELA